jgi:hypothetical protein
LGSDVVVRAYKDLLGILGDFFMPFEGVSWAY